MSFSLREGEILGVYGLLGAGRTELVEALAGLRPIASGEIALRDRKIHIDSVRSALKAGIVLMPEDRQRDGLVPRSFNSRECGDGCGAAVVCLALPKKRSGSTSLRAICTSRRTTSSFPVTTLSGGNQQKVLLARCLMCSPAVLLMDEPTRGVDVARRRRSTALLRELAAKGLSIIFTSSEIEETRALAHRVLVLCQGRISAEFLHDELSDERLFAAASPSVRTGWRSFHFAISRDGRIEMSTSVRALTGTDRIAWATARVALLLLRARAILVLVLLLILFSALAPEFLTANNLSILTKHVAITALFAVGMTFVVLTGGIDLSVGSIAGLGGMVAGYLLTQGLWFGGAVHYPPVAIVVLLTVCACLVVGVLNGWLVAKVGCRTVYRHAWHALYCARGSAAYLERKDFSRSWRVSIARQYRVSGHSAKVSCCTFRLLSG